MIAMQISGFQYEFDSHAAAEQEATLQLRALHTQSVQAKALSSQLEGILCANPHRNKEDNKLANLRVAMREWYDVRRRAIQFRRRKILPSYGT